MYMAHDVPGRLRLKFAKLRHNPYQLNKIRELLTMGGVYKININTVTGSVVVMYDPLSVSSLRLIAVLNDNGYPIDTQKENKKLVEAHEKIAATVGKATFSWIAGRVLEANGLSLIAAFI
ncbi:MAG: heavy-metal-associated domain-containing protein [Desulfobacula sp.]|nr:heavy-metal-associated domain-containing protein [Desulfobacula sp.]